MTTNSSFPVSQAPSKETTFSIRVLSRGKSLQIKPDQIIRLQANGSYTLIHAEASAPMMTARVLKTYATPLQLFGFVRVNKSDLVNKHKIVRMEEDGKVVMADDYVTTISRRKRMTLKSLLLGIGLLLATGMMAQNVGIGTTAPTAPLTVRTADTTSGAPVVSLANGIMDSLYQLNATRGDSSGGPGQWMTGIGQSYDGGPLSEALKFYRGTGANNGSIGLSTSAVERMRIMSNGTVGVGTSSPDTLAKLDVAGKLKLADGTQATGRFLKSDSMGMAEWADLKASDFLSDQVVPDFSCMKVLSRTPSLSSPAALDVSNNYAYVVNIFSSLLRTFDVADPGNPVETSSVALGTGPVALVVASDNACVVNSGSNTLQVFNLADPASPLLVGTATTGVFPVDVAVQGQYAYVINSSGATLQIFDINILPVPALVSSLSISLQASTICVSGPYVYIGNRGSDVFTVVDISNPSNPTIVFESALLGNYCVDMVVRGQLAYVILDNNVEYTLKTISLQNPQAPVVVGAYNLGFKPRTLAVFGNFVAVTLANINTLAIFNSSNPANLTFETSMVLSSFPHGVVVKGTTAYVSCRNSHELAIVNLSCEKTISINSITGEASANTIWESNGATIYTLAPRVGLGTHTAHAPLQLDNRVLSRKIVLYENNNNDHEYFGFGINPGMLRYQVSGASENHVFYAGANSSSSKELMRITGTGFVGIGTKVPTFPLAVRTSSNTEGAIVASLATAIADTFFQLNVSRGSTTNTVNSWMTAIGQSYNGGSLSESIRFMRGALTNDGAMAFTTNTTEQMRITSAGAIGIGTSTPFSKLDIKGNLTIGAGYGGTNVAPANGAIIEGKVGIGTPTPVSNLDIEGNLTIGSGYGGTNVAPANGAIIEGKVGIGTPTPVSNLDIEGNLTIGAGYGGALVAPANGAIIEGYVGIGTPAPHALLQLGNTLTNRKIVLYETTNNDHEYLGFGINGGMLRYQVANANDNHVFYSGINSTSSRELMRITGNGEVGIGTTAPHALLQLGNSTANRKLVLFESVNNDHQYFGLGNNTNSMRYQIAGPSDNHVFYSGINSTSSKELMRITGSGFVGIGTTAPLCPLTVRSSSNAVGAIVGSLATAIVDTFFQLNVTRGADTNTIGSCMTAIGQSYNGGPLSESINFLRGGFTDDGSLAFSTNYTERMRIASTGEIGIGTTSPEGPLHVSGTGITAPDQNRNYFNLTTGPNLVYNNSPSGNVQIIADGYFWANGGGFVATSDQRIKNIKGTTDTKQDLATLNAIEVTDYTYIDEVQNGSTPQKKVIAQQLQSVYPQAVNTNSGIIPNVFEVAASSHVKDQHTIITTSKPHEFTNGDQVRLILEGLGEKVVRVDVIDNHTFKVDELLSGKIFVYGKHVDDLLNVDYDAVAMLNVSATQELYKMILRLQSENQQLRADLESRLAKVESLQQSLEDEAVVAVPRN